ncbi:hypothetical protein B0H13DRAFT_2016941, partial [Mycena leptocephala]
MSGTESSDSLVHLRDSVYYLSVLITRLQKKTPRADETTNPQDVRAASGTAQRRTLKHLTACLSRGSKDEESRVVAVTIGPVDAEGVKVAVMGSPPTSRTSSPTVSPSSSSSASLSGKDGQDGKKDAKGTTRPRDDLILTRNSAPKDDNGTLRTLEIPSFNELETDAILKTITTVTNLTLEEIAVTPFHDFVEASLTILRAAAVYTLRVNDPVSVTTDVVLFFVAACWDKIQHRARAVLELYPLESLAWTPALSEMNLPSTKIIIQDQLAQQVLLRAEVPSQNNEFDFNGNVTGRWWKALLMLLKELLACSLEELSQDSAATFAGFSHPIHQMLNSMPTTFWAIPSLSVHLKKARKVVTPTEEGENEEEAMLTADRPLASTVDSECVLFHRAVDAVCAWTTGPIHLLQQPFSRTPIPLLLSVIDLPRRPINAVVPKQLLEYWGGRCTWTKDATIEPIVQSFRAKDQTARAGVCHCEAGLMASLVARHKPDEPLVTRPTNTVPIGVAEKCCPLCQMLGDALVSEGITVELPGRHNHYHPWVAPHWLPERILAKLEAELFKIVEVTVVDRDHLATSRSSSPGSDRGPLKDLIGGMATESANVALKAL